MKFDWQEITVALVVAGALFYVARRGLARLRSFSTTKGGAGCSTGCGKCGDEDAPPARPSPAIVRIGSSKSVGRGRG
jgi:hypothetical protein